MTFNPFPDFGRGADEAATLAGLKAFKTPLPEYLGAQAQEGFWASIPGQINAQGRRMAAEVEGETPMTAEEWRQSPSFRPTIPFDEKMTPSRAQATAETFDENAYRRWLIDQRKAGALDGTLGFIAGMVGSAPDPVNFIPWAGPAFRAARIARYGTIVGRAVAGAFEGAVGTAVAQPFLVPSRNQFGDDVGFADVAMDIAFGAFAGAAIGGGVGVWKRFRGERTGLDDLKVAPRETLADPVPDVPRQNVALYNLDTAARNVAEGAAVDIDPRTAAELAGLRITAAADQAAANIETAARVTERPVDFARAAEPEAIPVPERIDRPMPAVERPAAPTSKATPYEAVPAAPQRLSAFIKSLGGIKDQRGEISASMGRTNGLPGLINNKRGMKIDEAAGAAWEAGFFPEHGQTRPDMDVLIQALRDDLNGNPRYRPDENTGARREALKRNQEIDKLASDLGIDIKGMTRKQFDDVVAERMSVEDAFSHSERLAKEIEGEYARLRAEAEAFLATRGEAWEPDYRPEGRPRTLADLEAEDAQLRVQSGDSGRGQDAGKAGPAGDVARPLPSDSGQGRGGPDGQRGSTGQAASPERRDIISDTVGLLDDADALVAAGRLSAADAATLKAARDELTQTAAYDKAAPAAALCFRG